MKSRKKLSIREILAVSAILIVLAAVIAPAFTDSLEQLQQKTCFGNLGVLARAMLLYVNDNNSRFPNSGDITGVNRGGYYPSPGWIWFDGSYCGGPFYYNNPSHPWTWRANPSKGSLWPYTDKNAKTYMCPSDRYAVDPHATVFHTGFGLSYQVNGNIFVSSYGDSATNEPINDTNGRQIGNKSALLSSIVNPSMTVLLGENYYGYSSVTTGTFHATDRPPFDGVLRWWQCAATLCHQGGGNYAMCDGSVRWVPAADYRQLIFYRSGGQAASWVWSPIDPGTE